VWKYEEFLLKLQKMKEMANHYYETGEFMDVSNVEDPFYGVPKPSMIGQGYYALKPLAYLIDNPCQIPIICPGKVKSKLDVNIVPCDPTGDPDGIAEEMFTDNPEDLKEHRIDFIVEVNFAQDLPADFCRDVYVEYQFYLDEETNKTQATEGKNQSPVFEYRKQHTVGYVTDNFLEYLENQQVRNNHFNPF
jgi:hypothetical protein